LGTHQQKRQQGGKSHDIKVTDRVSMEAALYWLRKASWLSNW
jgi:hypothetical protein